MKIKNFVNKVIALIVMVCILTCVLAGCSSKSALVGTWTTSGRTYGEYYPKTLTIYRDGTFTADGLNGVWSVEGDTIMLRVGNDAEYYRFDVDDSELLLVNVVLDANRTVFYDKSK